jgi:hypothetical protein
MEPFNAIHLQRARDFSSKLNATFVFAKQNARGLFKSIVYIAGPPVLVVSMLLSSFVGEFMKLMLGAARNPGDLTAYFSTTNFWLQMILMFVFMIVSYVAIIATTNNYIILYDEKKTNEIEVHEVWERVRETLGMYFVTMLLFGVLFMGAYLLVLIPIFVLGAISPFLVFFGVLFAIIAIIYAAVGSSLVFAIRAFEKKGFVGAIRRSFYLVQGKWWSTFGLVFILSLLVGVISYVFSIPASIIQGVTTLHDVKSGQFNQSGGTAGTIVFILNSLAYICQLLLYLLPTIGVAFQYFNLVELKEAKGLMKDLSTLGQAPPPPTQEENY